MIGALLAVMVTLAVLFYFVNFPATGSGVQRRYHTWRERVAERRKDRYGYEKVGHDAEDNNDEKRSRTETSPTLRQLNEFATMGNVTAAVTTSANTPGLHNTPTLYSRRRKAGDLSLDEGAVAGLGITLVADQKSSGDTLLHSETGKNLPKPPGSAIHSARAYLSPAAIHGAGLARPRQSSTDLEAGLLKPLAHDRRRQIISHPEAAAPPPPPPPSPGLRVLEMVGGSVEYAAEKMSRFMYDSVKGDPEDGLLLPVRDCEREMKEC